MNIQLSNITLLIALALLGTIQDTSTMPKRNRNDSYSSDEELKRIRSWSSSDEESDNSIQRLPLGAPGAPLIKCVNTRDPLAGPRIKISELIAAPLMRPASAPAILPTPTNSNAMEIYPNNHKNT